MKPWAYYNDFDADACDLLEELIRRGAIAPGEVDRRSILEVQPEDVRGFTQCHYFAGIGGWSYALRLAGWPDDRPVWTGSPPCQPFSSAGRRKGKDDERHLGPKFASLVWACRPDMLFGEQVASADVFGKAPKKARNGIAEAPPWAWIDDLLDRLEAARYAAGASDLPSAGIGAPHIRQRTFFGAVNLDWLADADRSRHEGNGLRAVFGRRDRAEQIASLAGLRTVDRLADGSRHGWREEQSNDRRLGAGDGAQGRAAGLDASCTVERLADIYGYGCDQVPRGGVRDEEHHAESRGGSDGLDNALGARLEGHGRDGNRGAEPGWFDQGAARPASSSGAVDGMDDTSSTGRQVTGRYAIALGERSADDTPRRGEAGRRGVGSGAAHATNGFWRVADWLFCRDGKWRPVEARAQQMVDGLRSDLGRGGDLCADQEEARRLAQEEIGFPLGKVEYGRAMRLRGYGNAINPHVAAHFIVAFTDALRGGAATLHCQSPLELIKCRKRDVEDLA